ncbi:ABC transporter permease [Pedobacter steynii]
MKKLGNYFRPLGYQYEDAWLVSLDFQQMPEEKKLTYSTLIKQKLQAIKQVELVSGTQLIPFLQWGSEEKITYNKQTSKALEFEVDEDYQKVLGIKLVEGRWFTAKDEVLNMIPVVITKDLAERDFKGRTLLEKQF